MPKVSAIVPNYNYSQYLTQRIDSILRQTYQDFEIIILDDCSSDNSREIIERYREHPKVSHIVYNATNTGSPFLQWSKGISMASGKYIWIAEADDVADAEFLHHTVNTLDRHEDVAVAYTLSRLIDTDGKEMENHIETTVYAPHTPPEANGETVIYDGPTYFASRLIAHNVVYNASMVLFRADTFKALDIRIYEKLRHIGDWAFWSEMSLKGNIAEIRLRLNSFRQHQSSTTWLSHNDRREELQHEEEEYWKAFSPIAVRILASHTDLRSNALRYHTYIKRHNPPRHRKRRYIKYLLSSLMRAARGREPLIPSITYLLSISTPVVLDTIPPKQ